MLTFHPVEASSGSLEHGGDLGAARRMFPDAPEPFIDLSTGINPVPYPIPSIPADAFTRLPDRETIRTLAATACRRYDAPSPECVVAAPGTQILLPMVAALVPPGRAAVLSPTYSEHAQAARYAGHDTTEVSSLDALADADLAVLTNPNNPDGRIVPRGRLLELAAGLRRRGGLLVVDEAFADVAPAGTSLAGDTGHGGIVVLRSFGKFFGLSGVRLGFALTAPALARRLQSALGPWAVSGPAVAVAERALSDDAWIGRTIDRLAHDAERLDHALLRAGLDVIGGTSLFRLACSPEAGGLFARLGRAGILVRRFEDNPTWLRFGIPSGDSAWQRFGTALSSRSGL